jgi:hypothetical protein
MIATWVRWVGATAAAVAASLALASAAAPPRFYDDDPISADDDTAEDASGVRSWTVQDAYDSYENSFGRAGDKAVGRRAANVNTVDEVPDSTWFTNRAGSRALTAGDVSHGVCVVDDGPSAGRWTVSAGKSDGISPGFTITDPNGERWFVKFDASAHPGMASGSEAAASRLFWALGYNVPEYHVVMVRRDQLRVGEGARVQPPGAYEREMREHDIDALLLDAARSADGSFRAVASRALAGKPLGAFRFHGTRPDDPNDVVDHEHRRELRGLRVFSAWLNHVEARSSNTLDTLVHERGRTFIRHHLLDFGATMGSGTLAPRRHWEGFDYLVDVDQALKGMISFGFHILPWRRLPFHETPGVGRLPLDHSTWDPDSWKPRVPNPAFRLARADDTFWAARKLMALSDDLLRAAIRAGRFPDSADEDFLVAALAARRDAIGRAYLTAVNPIVDPQLDAAGRLTFRNAAVDAGVAAPPAAYRATWFAFDNATGVSTRVAESSSDGPSPAPPGVPAEPGAFVRIEIAADAASPAAWQQPVEAYFKRLAGGWKLTGFDRLPQ